MKFEHTKVMNFEGALRGMRNPMNSWDKSDSRWEDLESYISRLPDDNIHYQRKYIIGEKDMQLAQKLIRAGSEHRKFMRQIFVCVDITAPLYWFKEFDTYKVGTVANSTSTMHKLASTPITLDCFDTDDVYDFDALKEEFSAITGELMNKDPKVGPRIVAIVDKYLGKGKKVQNLQPEQAELLFLVVSELKDTFK